MGTRDSWGCRLNEIQVSVIGPNWGEGVLQEKGCPQLDNDEEGVPNWRTTGQLLEAAWKMWR